MKLVKNLKKVIALVLCLVTVFSVMSISASAASTSYNPDKAVEYAKNHYNDGKGLCAEFVSDCLKAGGFTAVYNVNAKKLGEQLQAYGTKISCSGWSSKSCFTAGMFNGTLSKGDIIVWVNKSGSSSSGHVMLYSGKNDSKGRILVYAHNSPKNAEIIKPSSSATTAYAIHLNGSTSSSTSTSNSSTTTSALKTGTWYKFTNSKSSKLLNVYGSKSTSNTNVTVYQKDGTSGQDFKLAAHGTMKFNGKTYTKYTITPRCASKCALNVYGTTSKNGSNVNIWTKSGNNTQDWIFESVNGGYVIRSANNTAYVLTASGTSNSSNVKLATYSAGNTYQIWKLS